MFLRAWLLLLGFVLFFPFKTTHIKDEGARALSPLHWGPQQDQSLVWFCFLAWLQPQEARAGQESNSNPFSPENQSTHEEWPRG